MKIGLIGASQPAVLGPGGPPELRAIVGSKTVIQAYPTRIRTFAYSPTEFAIQQLNYTEAGLTAAAQGCDALVFNSFADYGIAALRAGVGIPVIGSAEATLRFAPSLGPRFSIVTVWPASTNYMVRALLREHGAEAHCARIRNVGAEDILAGSGRPDAFVAAMQGGQAEIFERIVAQCEAAMRDDDIDSIILGCTCMSPIAARLAARSALPVLNPVAIAMKTAEMQVTLGLRIAQRCTVPARPASLETLRTMVGAAAAPGSEVCPVCVISAEA